MPVKLNYHIKGLERLIVAASQFPQRVQPGLTAAMRGAGEIVRSGVAKYPPSTAANRPPGLNNYSWYVRGFGTKTTTGREYPTSETLGKSWTVVTKGIGMTTKTIVGSRASYVRPVQDEEIQAEFHERRDWSTLQQVLREKARQIEQFVSGMVDKVLTKLWR